MSCNLLRNTTTTNTTTTTSSAMDLTLRRSNKAMDVPGQDRQLDTKKGKAPQRVIVKRSKGKGEKVPATTLLLFPVYMFPCFPNALIPTMTSSNGNIPNVLYQVNPGPGTHHSGVESITRPVGRMTFGIKSCSGLV